MQPIEQIRVAAFIGAVGLIYVLAAGIVVRWVRHKLGGPPPTSTPLRRRFRAAILGLASLGILCIAYGRFVEPYWLEVTRVRIATAKLAPGSAPLRIVHLSDLHCDPEARLEGRLPELVAAEKPDLIVFTGDSLNSPGGLGVLKTCLSRLSAVAPTFVVRGNWDAWYWKGLDLFGGTGVRELDGESVPLEIRGARIRLAGVAVEREFTLGSVLRSLPPEDYSILLHHYPDLIPEASAAGVDLYCAGHTHGGQVALPFYGALLTFSRFGKRYEGGLYRVGATSMYVNRGIGMEGGRRRG